MQNYGQLSFVRNLGSNLVYFPMQKINFALVPAIVKKKFTIFFNGFGHVKEHGGRPYTSSQSVVIAGKNFNQLSIVTSPVIWTFTLVMRPKCQLLVTQEWNRINHPSEIELHGFPTTFGYALSIGYWHLHQLNARTFPNMLNSTDILFGMNLNRPVKIT